MTTQQEATRRTSAQSASMWKFFVYSLIGAFAFFVPISIGGESSILLDHLVTLLEENAAPALPYYALAVMVAGAVYPFVSGTWRRSPVNVVFSALKVLGMVVGFMLVFDVGPGWLFKPDMGPFLFDSLVVPVGLLVPIGAVFLALLVGYGLLEYVGVLVQPVMRPVWRTPGRSAIDAVASFVGSYSLALLITNRVYREGKYSTREAAIIATGFSTVSATFMIVVAGTLDLMGSWNAYFWVTLVVTFLVTAVTVRIWPLSRMGDDYFPGATPQPETDAAGRRLAQAWADARHTVVEAPTLARNVATNFRDGLLMAMAILPSILSIGLIGLVLATYTSVFDVLGYIFYPVHMAAADRRAAVGRQGLRARRRRDVPARPTGHRVNCGGEVHRRRRVRLTNHLLLRDGPLRHGHRHPHLDPEDAGDLGRTGNSDAGAGDPGGIPALLNHQPPQTRGGRETRLLAGRKDCEDRQRSLMVLGCGW